MITTKKAFLALNKKGRQLYGVSPLLDLDELPKEVVELVKHGCWDYMMNITFGYTTERALEIAEYAMEHMKEILGGNKQ